MEHIYFIIAETKLRQADRLGAAEKRRLNQDPRPGARGLRGKVLVGLRGKVLVGLRAAMCALGRKAKAHKGTQVAVRDRESVGPLPGSS